MIRLEGITKSFGSLQVLRGIDLEIKKGEVVSIVGPSGAGKTTLLQIMGTLDMPDSGSVTIDGTLVNCLKEKELSAFRNKHIGFVFQFYNLVNNLTAKENVELATQICAHASQPEEVLKKVGLEDRMSQPVGLLSGGQRQALTLMMATFNPPKLLLLDEHTAALDPATAEKVLTLTKSIVSENNLTCLMITHNMQSALELGNRTIMMHGGNIIFDAEGEERSKLTVQDLLGKFKENAGKELDNDRMLLV